ncbi:MAG: patatin family protein [Dorea sp.]|nr:patatin family protein [Dorea sp.]
MAVKIGLVLEGGGIRGAYTAGALSWLAEQNIEFDYHVGISTGAAYLALHLGGETEIAKQMSTGFAIDPRNVGLKAMLHCGHFVDGDRIYTHFLKNVMGFDAKKLRESDLFMETGLYDLEKGEAVYYSNRDLDDDLDLIRAGCSLPLASEIVNFKGRKVLDGGITKMIPIERALDQGCEKCLIITTKPADFVRKPASKMLAFLMGIVYHKYPSVKKDYKVRHLNYYHQMDLIREMEKRGAALVVSPSSTIKVSRFKGDPEKCQAMYQMGYQDMEARKQEILEFVRDK